jgi:hypothetical protein
MARYKATIIFDVPDDESRSVTFQYISLLLARLGVKNARTRRALHHYLLDDMQEDIENRVRAENHYDLKGTTTTYEIVSWERLPVDCQSGVTS